MKFKVGDKVENNLGFVGKVQEVLRNGCFVNYGDYANFEFFTDLRKVKRITLKQANDWAKKNQKELEASQDLVKEFCEKLGRQL